MPAESRIWIATRAGVMDERTTRRFACWCVRHVWHLLTDERSRRAVEVAEAYADGRATGGDLAAGWAAARAAERDAARAMARDAACATTWHAARAASMAAESAASSNASLAAACAAERDADWATTRAAQAQWLIGLDDIEHDQLPVKE
jgi:hypothetical protein